MDVAARRGTDTTLIITRMHFNCQVFYLLSLWLENVIENGILLGVLSIEASGQTMPEEDEEISPSLRVSIRTRRRRRRR